MLDDELIAIHESGHAVAHHKLDIDQGRVSIEPDDEKGLAGHSLASDSFWNDAEVESQILAYLAGYGAVIASGEDDSAARLGCDSDFESAERVIKLLAKGDLESWLRKAVKMMSETANKKAVSFLAKVLISEREIEEEMLDVLLGLINGSTSIEDFESYLRALCNFGEMSETDVRRWLDLAKDLH